MLGTMPELEWTSEADDLRTIIVYLGLGQSSEEAQQITGLAKSAISEVLSGRRRRDTARRRHIAIVAAVVRELAEGPQAATGTGARRITAIGWLHTAAVETSRGTKSPILVFGDTDLVKEALDGLRR
jgi:hypothetical protein